MTLKKAPLPFLGFDPWPPTLLRSRFPTEDTFLKGMFPKTNVWVRLPWADAEEGWFKGHRGTQCGLAAMLCTSPASQSKGIFSLMLASCNQALCPALWPTRGHGSEPELTCQQDEKELGSREEGLPTDDSLVPGINHVDGSTG